MTTAARVPADSDEVLRALQAELTVTPSPDFVARIRQRVRDQPLAAPANWWPRFAFIGIVVVTVTGATVLWTGRTRPEPAGVANQATGSGTSPTAAIPLRGPEASRPPASMPTGLSSPEVRHRPATRGLASGAAQASHELPEVLVSGDERRALDRLLIAMRQGRAAVPASRRALNDENGQLLEPRPIEIPLLKPIDLLPGMAVDREGSKER
jgi:hypothetical protein